jgi:hypothetical protein
LPAIHGALLESKWKELPLPPKRTEFHIDNPPLLHRKSEFSLRFALAKPYVNGESSLLLEGFSLPLSLLSTQKNDALALPFLGNILKNSFILQLSGKEYNPSQRKLRKQYKGRKESIAKAKKKAKTDGVFLPSASSFLQSFLPSHVGLSTLLKNFSF